MAGEGSTTYGTRQRVGLWAGAGVFIVLLLMTPPEGLPPAAWRAAAVVAFMAIWWITEPIPVYATALMPLALFPVLGVADFRATAVPYANATVFLLMGGFMLALAMERWGLHKRLALTLLAFVGTGSRQLVGGILLTTVLISMWVTNTATTMMMLPLATSVILTVRAGATADETKDLATALVLAVAYGASIGGIATPVGTATNALFVGFMQQTYNYQFDFVAWMTVGVPLSLLLTALCWWLLTRFSYKIPAAEIPGARELLERERLALGPMSRGEKAVAMAFSTAAALWVFQPLINDALPFLRLSDAGIAMTMALVLFVVPIDFKKGVYALDWGTAGKLPWGVLILFGGGLSLAEAVGASGLAAWLGEGLRFDNPPPLWLLIPVMVAMIVFLGEIASNVAATATFLPILSVAAVVMGQSPLLLCMAGAMAASGGFMLPVATPPNAIAYGSGYVTAQQMARTGFLLDVIYIVVIAVGATLLVPWLFDITYGVVPDWATAK